MTVVQFVCTAFFAFAFFFLASVSGNRNQVTLKDGGYDNLLIAITKDETEDNALIDNIKEIFTEGSAFLFKATGRRVYWKTITILVPQSWTHRPEYELAKTETFDRTNVRIANGTSRSPYARLTEGCGKQGLFINLTPRFVRDKKYAVKHFGPRDKTIVHEWAHFRWGVYDEYPYPEDDKFVMSNKKIEATRCTKSVTGDYVDNTRSDGKCQLDPKTGMYTKTCVFEDDYSTQRAETSIMYKQFLPSINFFCNGNEVNPNKRHFAEAPNRHNRLCKGKSIWEVMLGTDDFKNGNNPPRNVDSTKPTFRIVQPTTTRRVVLVLDTSGSMDGDPLRKLRQATTHYLESTIYIGSYVAIVGFASSAYQLAPLTLVAGDNSRAELIAALPSSADGGTSIASGVRRGIQILSSNGQSSNGGYLLVVSDGKDDTVPSVFEEVVSSGVIIDTIAITEAADNILSELSAISAGRTNFYSGSDSITVLVDSLTATITDRPDQTNETLAIKLYSQPLTIDDTSDTVTSDVYIDTTVGVDTLFFFAWIDNPIQVVLHSPDGHIFDKTNVEYNLNSADEIITIRINGRAMAGTWSFIISNELPSYPSQVVSVIVESKQASADDIPITITSFVNEPSIDYQTTPYVIVFAIASKGNEFVANADAIAILERPNAHEDVIELYDSGANADILKDDGVYSGYFFNFTDNGRYSVEVKVRGKEDTVSIGIVENSRSFPIQGEEETIMKPVGMFERSVSGGVLQVSNYVDVAIDFLQPSRIIDLKVVEVSYQEQSVTLQWTAVGDDFDKGTATEYDLRFSETFEEILTNFSSANQLTPDEVISGTLLNIKQPGLLEEVKFRLPERGDEVSYYFGVMAIDEANNTGGVSNIVSANLEYIPPLEQESNGISIFVWILVAIGVAGVLMFVFIGLYIKHTRRSTTGSNGGQVHVNPAYA